MQADPDQSVRGHFVVAVSGGIASGKSAVSRAFEQRGIACHDADIAARTVVAPGEPGLAEIVQHFGPGVLQADGTLDRAAMRSRIFTDASARATLEAIIHPRVRQWLRDHIAADTGPYCLLAIPLLAETWPAYAWVDRVLIVDAPPELQLARLQQRDGMQHELALKMINAQATREQRLAIATDVIDNAGTLEQLDAAVEQLHHRYLELAPR
jgi:dephospho-CoA kinase